MPKSSKVVNVTSEYREQIRSLQTEIEQLQKTIKEKDSIIKRTLIKLEDATNENNEQRSKDTTN
jgi:prefoldin subunit 5|tara:strand:- start:447 stop:638 length:192 start_codon:yes stop_codon:yes gene_type:complete